MINHFEMNQNLSKAQNMFEYKFSLTLLASLIIAGLPMTSFAQAVIEEITVTAQKREQNLRDVPVSLSVISGDAIAQQVIRNFENLTLSVPNFSVSQNAIRDTVSIRGINSDAQSGADQSVGIYVDGIFRGRSVQSRFAFLDVERVEVLRGPQGTMFGKNTIAGALNIISAKPTDEFEASISAMYEFEHEETEIQAFLSGPLSENTRGRLAILVRDMDKGWVRNVGYDENMPVSEESAVRGTLEWDASENLTITASIEHGEFDINALPMDFAKIGPSLAYATAVFGIPEVDAGWDGVTNVSGGFNPLYPLVDNVDAIDLGTASFNDGESDQITLTAVLEMETGSLTALYGHSTHEFDRAVDADFGPLPAAMFADIEDFTQDSLELRFMSNADSKLNYTLGAYLQSAELLAVGNTVLNLNFLDFFVGGGTALGPPTSNTSRINLLDQESDTWALFAQATFDINEQWSVTAGVRYEEEQKDAIQSVHLFDAATGGPPVPPPSPPNPPANIMWWALPTETVEHDYDLSRSEEHWSPQVQVQWRPSDETMLYASWTQGHKGGGFNSFALGLNPFDPADDTGAEYENESADSYEIGAKLRLLDGAAQLNLNYFTMNFNDLQTTSFTGSSGFIVTNAAEANVQGIEIDGVWAVTEQLTLQGNFGWIDFEFSSYVNAGCTANQITQYANAAACSAAGGNDLTGRTNQDTPEFSGSLSALYVPSDSFIKSLRVVANYSDSFFGAPDLDPATVQPAFWKLNASIAFGPKDGNWEVALVGNNLTDEMTYMSANDTPLFTDSHFVLWQPARSIGLRFKANF